MKKKTILAVLAACVLVWLPFIPAAAASDTVYVNAYPRVYDEMYLLSDSEEARLSEKLVKLSEKYGFDFVVHTVYDLGDDDWERGTNAERWYDAQGYAIDGIMCTYEQKSNYKFITLSGACDRMLSDPNTESVLDVICPYADDGDYFGYFNAFLEAIPSYLDYYGENGEPYVYRASYKDKLPSLIIISLIAALIVAAVRKSSEKKKLQSVAPNRYAGDYIVNGSLNITGGADLFLYSNVTRTRRQTSSSSGGSSHTTHTSSSHSSSHGRH